MCSESEFHHCKFGQHKHLADVEQAAGRKAGRWDNAQSISKKFGGKEFHTEGLWAQNLKHISHWGPEQSIAALE